VEQAILSTTQLLNLSTKKSARELRQRGSDYRCCIPALAGFVSPQSIAPDGKTVSREAIGCAIGFSHWAGYVDTIELIWFDGAVKFFLFLCILATLANSCTTLSNRRDLYNPSEDAGTYNSLQQKNLADRMRANPAPREE
jgi:hypothetical protein